MSQAPSDGPFVPHHLNAEPGDLEGNHGHGRYLLLPGSDGRAARMAERLTDVTVKRHPRAHHLYLGRLDSEGGPVDVGILSTGMGTPSLDIIVTELFRLGGRRFVRVGTCGSLQPRFLRQGALVVPTAAVRDESTSRRYLPPEFPAVASQTFLRAVEQAVAERGEKDVHLGICHSKDSLFAREFGAGPMAPENRRYMEILAQGGALASEMEAAHLFVLGAVANAGRTSVQASRTREVGVRCGALMAVVGDSSGFAALDVEQAAEERLIDLAIEGIMDLAALERAEV